MRLSLQDLTRQVKASARLITREFGKSHLVEDKADATPVTAIDTTINAELCAWAATQGLGFIGEEGNGNEVGPLCLYADPLDGTGAFARGIATATMIATIMQVEGTFGRPLMAVIHNPITGQTWQASRGSGSYASTANIPWDHTVVDATLPKNGRWRTAVCSWPGVDERFATFSRTVAASPNFNDQQMGAFGLGGGLIASGLIHATAISSTSAVETAAMSLIVREAGGVTVDLQGRTIDEFTLGIHKEKLDFLLPDGAIVAASQEIADAMLTLY